MRAGVGFFVFFLTEKLEGLCGMLKPRVAVIGNDVLRHGLNLTYIINQTNFRLKILGVNNLTR